MHVVVTNFKTFNLDKLDVSSSRSAQVDICKHVYIAATFLDRMLTFLSIPHTLL